MKIKVRYFGKLTDLTDKNEEVLYLEKKSSMSELEFILFQRYPGIQKVHYIVFRNNTLLSDKSMLLKDSDDISIMPPFSGG